MHGEYKPPGGKLVAADVEMADGQLARVQISGDFFPEPDELGRTAAPVQTRTAFAITEASGLYSPGMAGVRRRRGRSAPATP